MWPKHLSDVITLCLERKENELDASRAKQISLRRSSFITAYSVLLWGTWRVFVFLCQIYVNSWLRGSLFLLSRITSPPVPWPEGTRTCAPTAPTLTDTRCCRTARKTGERSKSGSMSVCSCVFIYTFMIICSRRCLCTCDHVYWSTRQKNNK